MSHITTQQDDNEGQPAATWCGVARGFTSVAFSLLGCDWRHPIAHQSLSVYVTLTQIPDYEPTLIESETAFTQHKTISGLEAHSWS